MTTLFEKLQTKVDEENTWYHINPTTKLWLKSLCELIDKEVAKLRQEIENKPIGRMF